MAMVIDVTKKKDLVTPRPSRPHWEEIGKSTSGGNMSECIRRRIESLNRQLVVAKARGDAMARDMNALKEVVDKTSCETDQTNMRRSELEHKLQESVRVNAMLSQKANDLCILNSMLENRIGNLSTEGERMRVSLDQEKESLRSQLVEISMYCERLEIRCKSLEGSSDLQDRLNGIESILHMLYAEQRRGNSPLLVQRIVADDPNESGVKHDETYVTGNTIHSPFFEDGLYDVTVNMKGNMMVFEPSKKRGIICTNNQMDVNLLNRIMHVPADSKLITECDEGGRVTVSIPDSGQSHCPFKLKQKERHHVEM